MRIELKKVIICICMKVHMPPLYILLYSNDESIYFCIYRIVIISLPQRITNVKLYV